MSKTLPEWGLQVKKRDVHTAEGFKMAIRLSRAMRRGYEAMPSRLQRAKWMLAQALFQQHVFNALHQTPKESEYEQHEGQQHQAQTKQHTSPHKICRAQ